MMMLDFYEIVVVARGRGKGRAGYVVGKSADEVVAVLFFDRGEVESTEVANLIRSGYRVDPKSTQAGSIRVAVDARGRGRIVESNLD